MIDKPKPKPQPTHKEPKIEKHKIHHPEEKLLKEIHKTNKYLERYVSFKQAFLRGILAGLGGFLGATIVITLIISGLSQMKFVPIVGSFLVELSQFIQQNSPGPDSTLKEAPTIYPNQKSY